MELAQPELALLVDHEEVDPLEGDLHGLGIRQQQPLVPAGGLDRQSKQ